MNHHSGSENFARQTSFHNCADGVGESAHGDECAKKSMQKQGLSEQDMAQLKRAQKRSIVLAIILGLILMVSGFFAGRALRDAGDQQSRSVSLCSAVNESYSSASCVQWPSPRLQN